VRHKSEVVLTTAVAVFALSGVIALTFLKSMTPVSVVPPIMDPVLIEPVPVAGLVSPASWFQEIRPYCNSVDVETHLRWTPPPESVEGSMQAASCLALAGKIDRARSLIEGLPEEMQYRAAGVVFNHGHPAADAGDELAAGPLMELVVEFWPNHYMALYHAGAASFERGEHQKAKGYLERFLQEYAIEDGWNGSAHRMLEEIG
jgi:hypothetical protein